MYKHSKRGWIVAVALATVFSGELSVEAQQKKDDPKRGPRIQLTVSDMSNAKVAEPIVKELMKINGVEKVTPDIKTRSLAIVPKSGAQLSPKELWEAAERGNAEPTKLVMPGLPFGSR